MATAAPPSSVCPKCGSPLPAGAVFCPRCGTPTPQGVDRETGTVDMQPGAGADESANRERIQAALGPDAEVRRLLGRGGFAEVWVVYDRRLKREVAVKTLRPDLVVSTTLLDRFQREAEAVAMLRHPHVVPIYSVGEGKGIAYFSMPLIEGESLGAAVEREGQLPVPEACRILCEAAAALGAAHRVGLIHRDVKPENILLEGPERRALLMDFGIARSEDGAMSGLTATGMSLGTPHYMSPEQAVGDRNLDHRSDQYSLALVGYRMLTGRFPFESATLQGLIFKQVAEVPPPVHDVRPDVPQSVSDVLARALAKRPEDRFESMAAFAAALKPAIGPDGNVTGERRVSRRAADWGARTRAMRERMPRLRSLTVAAGVVGLIVVALTTPMRGVPALLTLAGQRADAVFTAKAFLAGRGLPAAWDGYAEISRQDSAYRFLQRTVGREAAIERGADIPLWSWRVNLRDGARDDHWHVYVGPGNRVVGYTHLLPDTAARATPPPEQSFAVAERELAARGWSAGTLQRLSDSTVSRRARTDRIFTWRRAEAIPWRGADSAQLRVQLRVTGNEVTSYRQLIQLPESYSRSIRGSPIGDIVSILGWIAVVGLVGAAIVLAIRRQPVDELQWRTGLRVVGGAAVLLCLLLITQMLRESGFESREEGAVSLLVLGVTLTIGGAIAVVAGLFVYVASESLCSESDPAMFAGVRDVAAGRVLVPELPPAAAAGYAYGLLSLAAAALGEVVGARLTSVPVGADVTGAFALGIPALWPISMLGAAVLVVVPIALMLALGQRWRPTARVALLMPVAVIVAMFAGADTATPISLASVAAVFLVLTVTLRKHGFLAAVIAAWVGLALDGVLDLLRSGSSDYFTAGLLAIAVMATPAFLAVAAWRAAPMRAIQAR